LYRAIKLGDMALQAALEKELRLEPWEESPLSVEDGPPPSWLKDEQLARWQRAVALRRELEAAVLQ
jgi:hypothetical protein